MNRLAYECYKQVMRKRTRDVLYGEEVPRNMRDADNMDSTWFQSEDTETGSILDFETWERMDQSLVTPDIRKKALRAHRIYTIKRPPEKRKKNRLVAQGNRQHPDTYTDTTSPVAALMEVRLFSTIINSRSYFSCTGDSKNAYLHSKLKDLIFIIIPEGFPGAGEIAILRKALYGTKQGARCYYDLFADTLKALGLTQCPLSPCLWRYLTTNPASNTTEACFILFYSDDNLIGGEKHAYDEFKGLLADKFDITFQEKLEDFLGLDMNYDRDKGEFRISMRKFVDKFLDQMGISKVKYAGKIQTPGLTNMKIKRGDDEERSPTQDTNYRTKTGSCNWLVAGLRYDINYSTKECSRVADNPTLVADQLMDRLLLYISQTRDAALTSHRTRMHQYVPPQTRRKPGDIDPELYEQMKDYNLDDGVAQPDQQNVQQEYVYDGHQMTLVIESDTDLGGQIETRQSTSGVIAYLDGHIIHWLAKTERMVFNGTTKAEYVGLTRSNALGKHITVILEFFGNKLGREYLLRCDNQAAEHLVTQPNMSESGRAIDLRYHSIRQDYADGRMRVGGVKSTDNRSDICTKYLQPPLHEAHSAPLFE
jgi:hypothetical protein